MTATLPLSVTGLGYRAGRHELLRGISFVLDSPRRLVVLGPNGAGKSLLLRLCHGLIAPTAMVIAQCVLVTPIIAALTRQVVEDLWRDYSELLRSLGAGPARALPTLLWDGRYTLFTAVLAGFGRASAEVGGVMIVGGNIDHLTRVMTTAIVMETSKGDLAMALGLGLVLIGLSLAVNGAVYMMREVAVGTPP